MMSRLDQRSLYRVYKDLKRGSSVSIEAMAAKLDEVTDWPEDWKIFERHCFDFVWALSQPQSAHQQSSAIQGMLSTLFHDADGDDTDASRNARRLNVWIRAFCHRWIQAVQKDVHPPIDATNSGYFSDQLWRKACDRVASYKDTSVWVHKDACHRAMTCGPLASSLTQDIEGSYLTYGHRLVIWLYHHQLLESATAKPGAHYTGKVEDMMALVHHYRKHYIATYKASSHQPLDRRLLWMLPVEFGHKAIVFARQLLRLAHGDEQAYQALEHLYKKAYWPIPSGVAGRLSHRYQAVREALFGPDGAEGAFYALALARIREKRGLVGHCHPAGICVQIKKNLGIKLETALGRELFQAYFRAFHAKWLRESCLVAFIDANVSGQLRLALDAQAQGLYQAYIKVVNFVQSFDAFSVPNRQAKPISGAAVSAAHSVDCNYGDQLLCAVVGDRALAAVDQALHLPDIGLLYRLWIYFKWIIFAVPAVFRFTDWGYTVDEHRAQFKAAALVQHAKCHDGWLAFATPRENSGPGIKVAM